MSTENPTANNWYPGYPPYSYPTYTYPYVYSSLTEADVRRIVREELDAAIERLAARIGGKTDASR